MQRRIFIGSCLLGVASTACRQSNKRVIGVAPKGTSSIFWQSVQAGVDAAGRDFDVEILWNGPRTKPTMPGRFRSSKR